jgi:hypothetical protein
MNLPILIKRLKAQKAIIERAIAILEQYEGDNGIASKSLPSRRGRKSMRPEERQQVSERMKRYWANRLDSRQQNPG